MMDGRIGVRSKKEAGSTFWFTVTLQKQPGREKKGPLPFGDVRGKRILIVDDNTVNRNILRELLIRWGCRPDESVDAFAAITDLQRAVAENDPFEIAVIDMQMPGMDGEALGRKIKQDSRLNDTALIMLTSIGMRGDVQRMKEIGFAAYLTKPVKQSNLYDCLAAVTGLKDKSGPGGPEVFVTRHLLTEKQKQGVRVLLAEDDVTNQKVALHVLGKFGYKADAVANGEEAVRALEMVPYDLVLMDVQMPEMDGFEATDRIRSSKDTRVARTPIIAMTAHAMPGDREKCLQAGMDDYTTKPINPRDLQEKLATWILRGQKRSCGTDAEQPGKPEKGPEEAVFAGQ